MAAKTFSEILQEWKDRVGWTDQRIADELGISRPAVNQWLNKKSSPAIRQLPAVAKLLKRDPLQLAAMIIGEEIGAPAKMTEAQSSLLADTYGLSNEEMAKVQAMIRVMFPRDD